ncbi:hypothetical protein OAP32_00410 [Crocinitomicaceae bacterium]|nr:hypothetical protein [Crocinitomicaceae bacterium]
MFKRYTPIQYVQIALSNAAGFEKTMSDNETKILWASDLGVEGLEQFEAEDPMAYADALQAYKDALSGTPSGFICGMDAGASGAQMLAVLTGDLKAAIHTGLAKAEGRGDFYKAVVNALDSSLDIDPKDVKSAVMTALYMSEKIPEEVFGAENLALFEEALNECAPYVYELLVMVRTLHQDLQKTSYEWTMPNGYHVYTPTLVTDKLTTVEMLGGSFRYETKSIEYDESYKGLLANLAHSTDAFVSDEVGDRTGYDKDIVTMGLEVINKALAGAEVEADTKTCPSIRWINDMGMGKYRTIAQVLQQFTLPQLQALKELALDVLNWKSYPNFARHDEFCSYPAAMNEIRYHYQTVMSQIAASDLLSEILSSICDEVVEVDKIDISAEVKAGNYGLN